MVDFSIIKILFLTTFSFIAAILWTPLLTNFLYKYKLDKQIRDSKETPIFSQMHKTKEGTPTMGGLLIWVTVLVLALIFFYLGKFLPWEIFKKLNFLSRSQTLLPLGALVASALVGLLDDYLDIKKKGPKGRGLGMRHRLIIYSLIAIFGAWWFYFKLDWDIIHIPFFGNFDIGWWYIPIFIFTIVATAFSVNEIDGLDGLAGGTLLSSFAAYGIIAFFLGKADLAALCGVISGALVAFLWFNIYPARFFMGDTGAMSLGVTLGVIAMLTNYALLMPIIGFLFVIESLSVIIQVISKKIRKKKVFLSAPIHHHLEAKGWIEPKIVMRFWMVSWMTAAVGLIIFLIDKR
ncbi:MAG: Phospho-N-acetylmuramoyl-pentapeptide-transferase [Parcubacteria group bacterium Athens1014_10]|nr:MAG: Phospho-N-acetylmuramoyl-pentapeptide-transferase [Parcubacteria group bacterium Athens1014_10]TSD06065.1 MAG: Phospho-N-acetylmuramoyl-pentapeptide-transferase [Parcubacteria group bacterium Athens0714_12]